MKPINKNETHSIVQIEWKGTIYPGSDKLQDGAHVRGGALSILIKQDNGCNITEGLKRRTFHFARHGQGGMLPTLTPWGKCTFPKGTKANCVFRLGSSDCEHMCVYVWLMKAGRDTRAVWVAGRPRLLQVRCVSGCRDFFSATVSMANGFLDEIICLGFV